MKKQNEINLKEFVKDCLSEMETDDLLNKWNLKYITDISKITNTKEAQEEIRKQQKPLSDYERETLKSVSSILNKAVKEVNKK